MALIIPQNTLKSLDRLEKIDAIIVHHSEGAHGNAEFIDKIHRTEKGYACIGYHFVICNGNGGDDGLIEFGRPVFYWGAQARGHNNHTLGVCLVGNMMDKEPTSAQSKSLETVVKAIRQVYGPLPVRGHRDFNNTLCPGDKLYDMIKRWF